ncbi:MAG: class I SAM-dependent methyltransferase [Myxococcota bacterium]|nr:class I SAM-dependent methyltransferase [Myxococcota bacterium]
MLRNFFRPAGKATPGIQVESEASRPDPEDLALVAEVAAGIEVDSSEVHDWFERYREKQQERLAFDLGLVRRFSTPGDRIVDLGASPPILSGAIAKLGLAITGVDIDPSRFSRAFNDLGIEAVACNLETEPLPLDDASAELVVLHEVFEHLRIDLIHSLGEVARVLVPGGRLLLSTPNLLSASGLQNLLLRGRASSCSADPHKEFSKLRSLGHMGHVREYTTLEVCEFLAHFGLQAEHLVFRGRAKGIKGPLGRLLPPLRPFFEVVAVKASV